MQDRSPAVPPVVLRSPPAVPRAPPGAAVPQPAVADTRERPYKVEKPKYDARTHTPERFYILRDTAGNEIGREKTSKAAEQAAKEFVTDYKETVNINVEYVTKEKNSLYATVAYTPSKGAQKCKILAFGYPVVD